MKRRAQVQTDHELAEFMGAAQSTVSNWRKRERVPEAAILRFERCVERGGYPDTTRRMAARSLALRLPELYYEQLRAAGASGGRKFPYEFIGMVFNAIVAEVERQLQRMEDQSNQSASEIAGHLIEDQTFLSDLLDWAKNANASDLLAAEALALERQAQQLLYQSLPMRRRTGEKPAESHDS